MNERDAFLRAIDASPADDAPKLVFADWLDDHGEPDAALSLRRSVHAAHEWSAGGEMTGKQFSEGTVAQDDDNDYSESGWVAVVVGDRAYLGNYSHCSCYDTWSSLCGGGISDYYADDIPMKPNWRWSGTVAELIDMARREADPSLPCRRADPKDYDYDHLSAVYRQVMEWAEKRKAAA